MTKHLEKLIKQLEVEAIDSYLFIGDSPRFPPRIFGGQVLAQALNAASRTVSEDRIAHSMHAYFLRPGDPSKRIVYEVDPIRDGNSFTTRRVVAKQEGKAIFNTSISFQGLEEGLEHQATAPTVPQPEDLETDAEYWERKARENPEAVHPAMLSHPIERRTIDPRDEDNPQPKEAVQHFWFRVPGNIGDDPVRHQTLLAYISDFGLLDASLLPHPYTPSSQELQVASLDHAIWFHQAVRVDEYLLYTMDSPSASGGRGMNRGSFYNREGVLIASTAQESLIRVRKPS
ncbi:acyl-CoA thioesterase II [Parahaliea sp. F7430]|uniref:Acyl-CoA thioesterase 2 n=1 Tax=Sediminihaliea albiluteola TaxID=2758564 RepID=A0A7W2TYE8_9GAMM|nr:acyl-CoA thioesterase II [Sediminihaliea albiluteola]MBA6414226.1 acyl-CoA thioesterase II [Sediminihaliea albiluteola]